MMRSLYRSLALLVLFVPLFGVIPSVSALTNAEARECMRFNGKTYGAGSNDLAKFLRNKCSSSKNGNCTSVAQVPGGGAGPASRYKINCTRTPNSQQSPSGSTGVNSVSTTCGDANGVCLSGVPRTTADSSFVRVVLNIVIGIIAAISVLFVVIGGMRYIFSQGDPQAAAKGRLTIIYALVGLAVAVLAQVIVVFVVKAFA